MTAAARTPAPVFTSDLSLPLDADGGGALAGSYNKPMKGHDLG
jgi:hypothetical protein